MPVPRRVGIVLMSALGDVTLGLPVAVALKRANPRCRITWIVQPGPHHLVHGHPAVDEVLLFDRTGGIGAYLEMRRALRAHPFDVVLDLQPALKAGLVTWLASAPVKWGVDAARAVDRNPWFTTHQLPPQPRRHMADLFAEFVRALGADPEPWDARLAPTRAARTWADQTLGTPRPSYAVLVLASSAAHKNWRPERWAAVARHLARDRGLAVVLAGGDTPLERAIADAVRRELPEAVPALGCGIPNLLGLLDGAALVVAPDTGPLHMAVALGRPVIGLYAGTNPLWVGPYRADERLLVDRFFDPGEPRVSSRARRPGRMDLITVDDVLDRVARWAETAPAS